MKKNTTDSTLNRTTEFSRNQSLEELLKDINSSLWKAEEDIISDYKQPTMPMIFIMGPMRSGTTLLMQWLAKTGIVSYPSNLMSRFYNAPVIGSKIQLMLTDERYDFRNELRDFTTEQSYLSENGKTKGILAPNEFWYFWRRFLANPERDDQSNEDLKKGMDTDTMLRELDGIAKVFDKPFACKAMLFNSNIDFLSKIISKPIFIHVHREPKYNMQSVLQARENQLGSREKWYSFKIKEYQELSKLDPVEQVAGQIYYMNKSITDGLKNISDDNKIDVNYESFCHNPKALYVEIVRKLETLGYATKKGYSGVENFTPNKAWHSAESEASFTETYTSFEEKNHG